MSDGAQHGKIVVEDRGRDTADRRRECVLVMPRGDAIATVEIVCLLATMASRFIDVMLVWKKAPKLILKLLLFSLKLRFQPSMCTINNIYKINILKPASYPSI